MIGEVCTRDCHCDEEKCCFSRDENCQCDRMECRNEWRKLHISDSYAQGKRDAKELLPTMGEISIAYSFVRLADSKVDKAYWLGLIRGYREFH